MRIEQMQGMREAIRAAKAERRARRGEASQEAEAQAESQAEARVEAPQAVATYFEPLPWGITTEEEMREIFDFKHRVRLTPYVKASAAPKHGAGGVGLDCSNNRDSFRGRMAQTLYIPGDGRCQRAVARGEAPRGATAGKPCRR